DAVHAYLDSKPETVSGVVVYSLMRLREPARALEIIENGRTSNDAVFLSLMWSPYGNEVRALPQFPAFTRCLGFAEVWDNDVAPDDCTCEASGDYVCR